MDVLLLNQNVIKDLVNMKEVLNAVENAFKEKALEKVQMPPKQYLYYKKYYGDLRVMPSYMEVSDKSGIKIVNVHPENPKIHNLPTIMAVIILIDPKTGSPISIMDGTYITAMRTGAGSGIATKYLARQNSKSIGIIGAGGQSISQLTAVNDVLNLEEVKIYDIVYERVENFLSKAKERFDLDFIKCNNIENCVTGSDVITTLTPVRKAIIKDDWIVEGMHINAVGADAPGKEELDPNILKRAKIVIDDWDQAIHSGEVNVPLKKGLISKDDIHGTIGEVVCGKITGRISDSEITIFDTTGLSIQDVAIASLVYEKAKVSGIGDWITL